MGGEGKTNERLEKNFVVKRRKERKIGGITFCLKTNSKRDQGHSNKIGREKGERA